MTKLDAMNLGLPSDFADKAVQYLELLQKWNRVYNLTAVREPREQIVLHILDSLSPLSHLRGPRLLDVGTGAGLPGLILALARPDWQWVLLDSNSKKTRFVTQAVAELGLASQVQVVCSRIQDYQAEFLFNTVISRAYTELPAFYQQTQHLCLEDGLWAAMKGKVPETEIEQLVSEQRLQALVEILSIPGLAAERHLICLFH